MDLVDYSLVLGNLGYISFSLTWIRGTVIQEDDFDDQNLSYEDFTVSVVLNDWGCYTDLTVGFVFYIFNG